MFIKLTDKNDGKKFLFPIDSIGGVTIDEDGDVVIVNKHTDEYLKVNETFEYCEQALVWL